MHDVFSESPALTVKSTGTNFWSSWEKCPVAVPLPSSFTTDRHALSGTSPVRASGVPTEVTTRLALRCAWVIDAKTFIGVSKRFVHPGGQNVSYVTFVSPGGKLWGKRANGSATEKTPARCTTASSLGTVHSRMPLRSLTLGYSFALS